MKKLLYILPILTLLLISCSEKNEAGEYDNWQARNQHYVDSIAALAESGTDGWSKMLAYTLVSTEESPDQNVNHYIYVKKLEAGEGTRHPEYKDSVRVHYLGRLIPSASYPQGKVFDKTYNTYTLNPETDVPILMGLGTTTITGFSTAVMHMVEGDRWSVVIPNYLGYGAVTQSTTSLPAYSTLIFDVQLARIYRYKIDTDTTW